MRQLVYLPVVFSLLTTSAVRASESLDIMPEWTLEEVRSVLQETAGTRLYPPAEDREAWDMVRAKMGEEWVQQIIASAEREAKTELPALPATLFLDFHRTGTRTNYQREFSKFRRGWGELALAECLENQGRFLDPLLDKAWQICHLHSWELPAHTPGLLPPGEYDTDLAAADIARELGLLVHVLGKQLHPVLVKQIRHEVYVRVLEPFADPDVSYGWERSVHNWNSVCISGVLGAALALEDGMETDDEREMLYAIVTRAQNKIIASLHGFGVDGGTSEGISYWNYGFSNYAVASALLEKRTAGKLTFLDGEHVRNVIEFPVGMQLSPGQYPSFSDAPMSFRLPYWTAGWLSQRLDYPLLLQTAREQGTTGIPAGGSLTTLLLSMDLGNIETRDEKSTAPRTSYCSGIEWRVGRAAPEDVDGFVYAAKCGNNYDNHNHNDVGNFIVHWKGESLIADPGAPVYTRDFFGPNRYDFFSASSKGHSVPVAGGQLQAAGHPYEGKVLKERSTRNTDRFEVDIRGAYPEQSGLSSLVREFDLSRKNGGQLTVTDRVKFAEGAQAFEETLITFGQVETLGAGRLRITGQNGALDVDFKPAGMDVDVETYDPKEEQLRVNEEVLHRILLKHTGEEFEITMRFTPVP